MHLLFVTDEMGIVDHSIQTLKSRGVKIVQLPSAINDHSILVIRHPKKETAQLVKQLVATGKFQG